MSHLIPFCFVNGLWLKAGVRYAISSIQGQVHQILSDNIPAYNIDDKSKIFQGVYRLLSIESSPEILKDSLRNVALDMPKQDIAQVSVQ
ncbi:hypothetical protein CSA56_09580 [candidate division KSB3 bacterium]|uniref:Uncharacterized protein n=1 Tax=candidate division KSB3 bacterium TaxID=2044937 RepID=A0A2G6KE10_9BACT|nr:MAG: hypothetical protein CSA56_09580 [candidate division KSB3 bacterium]